MAEKLTPEKIEEAAKHLKNIQKDDKRILPLIPPSDPRLLMQIAPFVDDTLKEFDFKDRKDLSQVMYDTMSKYGGLGLAANQVGLPYRMFVMGGHPQIESGKVRYIFNPLVNDVSEETINLKEGCLSFPFLFLSINRPKWVSVNYTDENGEEVSETLHGMSARIFQHENEHMNGYIFTDLVSKFKLDRAETARKKLIKQTIRNQKRGHIIH